MTENTARIQVPLNKGSRQTVIALAICSGMMTANGQPPIWSDEFDTGSAPDAAVWSYDLGNWGWGNQELQNYTSDAANVRVEGGNLIITALRDGDNFTSARIKTEDKLTFKYATVEARIKTPDLANGLWPAFWTLGNDFSNVGWAECGEIDIMEMGHSGAIADGAVNRRVGSAGHFDKFDRNRYYADFLDRPTDINDTFVIYRMVWTPTTISTYIDNALIWTMDISDPETSNLEEFHEPHFLLLNMAVGGRYTGILDPASINASFPAEYVVDYIRIYGNGNTIVNGSFSNHPPAFSIDPLVRSNADENGAYSDTLAGSATDADGNYLIYTKTSGPAWLNVAPDGTLSGTPGLEDLGLNSWTVQVSDSFSSPVSTTLEITVIDTNDDPVFFLDTFSKPNAADNRAYSNSIFGTATDADAADTLTYVKFSGPAWLSVAGDGALSGTPSTADVGLNSFTILVFDGNGGTDTATLNITVEDVNDAPVFSTDPIIMMNAVEGFTYSTFGDFAGRTLADWAMDADPGDTLEYSKVSGPDWLVVYKLGRIGGTPGALDVGLNHWTVQVSDGNGGTDTATLEIAVYSVLPPVMEIQASGSNLEIRWPASFTTYSLFGTTNLMPPVIWSAVTNTPSVQGADWMVTMPIDQAPSYFQLEAQ